MENTTALQKLIEYIIDDESNSKSKSDILNKAQSLLEIEKQDLISAWKSGKNSDYYETSQIYINKKYSNAKIHNQ